MSEQLREWMKMYMLEFGEPFFLYELEGHYPTEEDELIKLIKACCNEDKPVYEYLKVEIVYDDRVY